MENTSGHLLKARWALLIAYAAAVTFVYSQRGLGQLNEIARIPAIDYILAFVIAALIGGGLWLSGRRQQLTHRGPASEMAAEQRGEPCRSQCQVARSPEGTP